MIKMGVSISIMAFMELKLFSEALGMQTEVYVVIPQKQREGEIGAGGDWHNGTVGFCTSIRIERKWSYMCLRYVRRLPETQASSAMLNALSDTGIEVSVPTDLASKKQVGIFYFIREGTGPALPRIYANTEILADMDLTRKDKITLDDWNGHEKPVIFDNIEAYSKTAAYQINKKKNSPPTTRR